MRISDSELNGQPPPCHAYHWDNMSYTVTRVNDGARQASVLNFAAGPASCESKYGLNRNVKTGAVERFEHNLGSVLSRLWGIQGLQSAVS
jgi:hypothetical protein